MRAALPNSPFGAFLGLLPLFDAEDLGNVAELTIERLDRLAGDPDIEEDDPAGGDIVDQPHDAEEDCCVAGDDRVCSGPAVNFGGGGDYRAHLIGNEDDAERSGRDLPMPDFDGVDQSFPLNFAGQPFPGYDRG